MQVNEQNTMANVAKTQPRKKKTKKHVISRADRKKLYDAYRQLYAAMFRRELLAGKTIGAASYNAFQFIKAKIKTMDAGPVKRFLRMTHAIFSKHTQRRIMPSKNRDAFAVFVPEKRREFESKIPLDISNALRVINAMSAQYKPKQKTVAKPNPGPVQKPMNGQPKPVLIEVISIVADPRAFALQQQRQK